MNKFNKIFLAALLLLPFSCYEPEDEELERTEIGKDVFDIELNYRKFTEGDAYTPSSLVVEDGKICFSLHGDMDGHYQSWEKKRNCRTLSFIFPLDSMKIEKFSDVTALDKVSLDFEEDSVLVLWKQDFHVDTLNIKSGVLNFTRARLIGVDGDRNSVILAGDIHLIYPDSSRFDHVPYDSYSYFPREVKGWFDVVIGRGNFENRK